MEKMNEDGGGIDETALDTVFELLTSPHRRAVLHYLRDTTDELVSFEDVVDHVITYDSRFRDEEEVVALLHHVVIPKLEAAKLIEYDGESRTVRYRGDPVVERLLEYVTEVESTTDD
ncbi:DUF7344 domain-containing protein [Haladaptatus sp. NG-SE-30]